MLKQFIIKSKWQEIRDLFCRSFESSSIWGISSPSSNFILQKSNVVLCCHFKLLIGYHFIICFTIFYYIRPEHVSARKWVKLMNYKLNYIELPVLTLNKSKSTCISKKMRNFILTLKCAQIDFVTGSTTRGSKFVFFFQWFKKFQQSTFVWVTYWCKINF